MCGIAGWVRLTPDTDWKVDTEFDEYFRGVLRGVAARGPDAFGYYAVASKNFDRMVKYPPDTFTSDRIESYAMYPDQQVCLANFRGIPTTESDPVDDPRLATQPFVVNDYVVTHNGLFSNDREVSREEGFPSVTGAENDIDTYVLAKLLTRYDEYMPVWFMPEFNETPPLGDIVRTVLERLEGSYSVACYSRNRHAVILARTFLGLWLTVYISRRTGHTYLVWASEAAALRGVGSGAVYELPLDHYCTFEVEELRRKYLDNPRVDAENLLQGSMASLDRMLPADRKRMDGRVAVVLSGGLDSTVCATLAAADPGTSEVHLLHFRYGARAEEQELKAVTAIGTFLRERHPDKFIYLTVLDLSFLKNLGGSTLTDHSMKVAQGEEGVETAHEWVPARNLVMISMAAAFCDRFSIGRIMLGLNREESAVFSDNSSEFFTALQPALDYGARSRPKLDMPLGNSMKHHIVRKGLDAGAPLHLTHSCYHGDDNPCGNCGPCWLRLKAFLMNNEREVQKYLSYPDWFPDRLKCEDVG